MKDKLKWVDPKILELPHAITKPIFVQTLAATFRQTGWDDNKPALVGYWTSSDSIQLLTGCHRAMAAKWASISVPVVIHSFEFVRDKWGTPAWADLMESGDLVHVNE